MKCPKCNSHFDIFDAKVHGHGYVECIYCFSRVEVKEERDYKDVTNLMDKWGIDESLAIEIVDNKMIEEIKPNMFILDCGEVVGADSEDELRLAMFSYLYDEQTSIGDIAYIFVDGKPKELEIDIQFRDEDNDPNEPDEHYTGAINESHLDKLMTGQSQDY